MGGRPAKGQGDALGPAWGCISSQLFRLLPVSCLPPAGLLVKRRGAHAISPVRIDRHESAPWWTLARQVRERAAALVLERGAECEVRTSTVHAAAIVPNRRSLGAAPVVLTGTLLFDPSNERGVVRFTKT
jgi:hypothetical protein